MKWSLVAFAITVGVPGSVVGQVPPGQPRQHTLVPSGGPHGRIGVLVKTGAAPGTDSIGAWVEAVTPGGPAAKAGLKAGDIITKFNGMLLAGVPAPEENASGPGRKLVMLAHSLAPGDTAPIEYRRGADSKRTKLVTEDLSPLMAVDPVPIPEARTFPPQRGEEPGFSFCFGEAWCEMELVSLTPELGEYFGTKEGVLVVKAPGDSSLPLKSGDVLLSIGGRRPRSPSHAMHILRSYETGETVTIDILRRQKRVSIAWQVPRSDDRVRQFMRLHRMMPDSDPGTPRN
jgi:Trypsin-like serine proteases, typically periplasmic, contain C-terminal PDZ domain